MVVQYTRFTVSYTENGKNLFMLVEAQTEGQALRSVSTEFDSTRDFKINSIEVFKAKETAVKCIQ